VIEQALPKGTGRAWVDAGWLHWKGIRQMVKLLQFRGHHIEHLEISTGLGTKHFEFKGDADAVMEMGQYLKRLEASNNE
jgi:hypothetical protein